MKNTRVLLISAQRRDSWLRQHGRRAAAGDLGIRALASWLNYHGIQTDILPDWRNTRSTLFRMVAERPDLAVLGISAHVLNLEDARDSAALVRQIRPSLPVILGGYLPTFAANRLLAAWPEADGVIRGEGEHALLDLVKQILNGGDVSEIQGFIWRASNKISQETSRAQIFQNLDDLPLPLRTREDMPPIGEVMISASRGCYGRCRFCSVPNFDRRSWRGRSPELIASEMALLVADFGATFVHFVDDSFFGPKHSIERAIRLRDALRHEGIHLPFRISMRVNDVDESCIRILQEAGLVAVQLGVESFSDRQLSRTYSKGVRAKDNRRAIDILNRLGVHVQMGLILFEPGTTLDDLLVNAQSIKESGNAVTQSTTSRLHCAEGTDLARELVASGRSLGIDDYLNHRWEFEHPEVGRVMRLVQEFEAPFVSLGTELIEAVTPPVRLGLGCNENNSYLRYQHYKRVSFEVLMDTVRNVGSGSDDEAVLAGLRTRFEKDFHSLQRESAPMEGGDEMPMVLHLELTNRCNLECTICANVWMRRSRGDMSFETFEMILSRIDESDIRQVILNTIGETLLFPHLKTVLGELKRRGLFVLVSTNGQLLDESKARILLDGGCDLIRISVNADNAREYEAVHINGRFDRLLANVERLVALRDHSGAPTAVRLRSVLPRDPEQAAHLQRSIEAFWSPRVDQVEFVLFGNMGGRNGATSIVDHRRVPCSTIWRGMNVLLDGRVSWCPCDFDANMMVGSLWTRSLHDIWEDSQFISVRRAHHNADFTNLPWCQQCDATRQSWYEQKRPAVTHREEEILNAYLRIGRDYMGHAGSETQ